jgi:hypothetical protein
MRPCDNLDEWKWAKFLSGLGLYFSFFFPGLVSISGRYTVKRNTNSFFSSFLSPSPSSWFCCFYRSVCANIIYELCIMCTHTHTHTQTHTHTNAHTVQSTPPSNTRLAFCSFSRCVSVPLYSGRKYKKYKNRPKIQKKNDCGCVSVPLYIGRCTHTSTGLQNVGFFCIFGVTWASA